MAECGKYQSSPSPTSWEDEKQFSIQVALRAEREFNLEAQEKDRCSWRTKTRKVQGPRVEGVRIHLEVKSHCKTLRTMLSLF